MIPFVIGALAAVLLWTIVGPRLERLRLPAPLVMAAVGLVVGLLARDELAAHLDTVGAEKVAELILALLLFADATEVRGGFFAGERGIVLRLLLIALPLSLLVAFVVADGMLGDVGWAVALVLVCTVIPTDFAPAAALLRNRSVPFRVRHVLNVESGYNDGIVSPLFVFALAVAEQGDEDTGPYVAFLEALPGALIALAVGGVIGLVAGYAVRRALHARWASVQGVRIAMVLVPLITYLVATQFDGNGFVAAFVAGVAYKLARVGTGARHRELQHAETGTLDDLGLLAANAMWFVFGAVLALVMFAGVSDWRLVLFGVLALTVLRLVPVLVALLGSSSSWAERTMLGLLGPRGIASIVFGLLAFNALDDDDGWDVLYTTAIVVVGSMIIHGPLASLVLRGRLAAAEPGSEDARL